MDGKEKKDRPPDPGASEKERRGCVERRGRGTLLLS